MTAGDEIKFLRSLQRLLDEGDFTATYKFALLQALSDLSVEDQSSGNGPLVLSLERISEKFIEYYWDQALPFRGEAEGDGILRQNNFNQASVVTEVIKARSACDGNLAVARRNAKSWSGLVKRVAHTIEKMPLWKLQVIAGKSEDFLYRKSDYVDRKLTLLPGVGANLRAFHGLVTRLVRGRWVERIRTMKANQDLIGKGADLEEFLFGSTRRSLDAYGKVLHEIDGSSCFYCEGKLNRNIEVDHFIPWARYPIDLGHNFVLAHGRCNSAKRDFLAHPDHLAHWVERNRSRGGALADAFRKAGLPQELDRSLAIARWAYRQGQQAGAHAWRKGKDVVPLDHTWEKWLLE